MPNYPPPYTGQQAVTTVATPLAATVPQNPMGNNSSWAGNSQVAPLGAAAGVRGEGWRLILTNRSGAAGNQVIFYGGSGVTTANGKEIAQGNQDSFKVNDPSSVFVISASNNAIVSWSLSVDP